MNLGSLFWDLSLFFQIWVSFEVWVSFFEFGSLFWNLGFFFEIWVSFEVWVSFFEQKKLSQNEWISKGMFRFCWSEEQIRDWISITMWDTTMVLFSAYRSIRGGGLNYSWNFDLMSSFLCKRLWSWTFFRFFIFLCILEKNENFHSL